MLFLLDPQLGSLDFPLLEGLSDGWGYFRLGYSHSYDYSHEELTFDAWRVLVAALLKCTLQVFVELVELVDEDFLEGVS